MVVNEPSAVISGSAAWHLHRILTSTRGGAEELVDRARVPLDRRDDVLRAISALGFVGKQWEHGIHAATPVGGNAEARLRNAAEDGEEMLSTADVAILIDRVPRRVRQLVVELDGVRDAAGQWRFPRAAVAAYIEERRAAAADA
jgi:hypothetical protein